MAYARVVRAGGGALAGALLWTGCTTDPGGDGKPSAAPSASAPGGGAASPGGPGTGPSGDPAPVASPGLLDYTPDPARLPRTKADARKLAQAVVAGPELWGPGYVKRTPYLSAPGHWPVLGEDCVWHGGTQPPGVLYSVTAYSELPATGGKGPVRVAATVTVHRDDRSADWEMAETLEEALRCPDQKLRDGERISGLLSLGTAYGKGNFTAHDSVAESGQYHNEAFDAEYIYDWYQARLGQVTVAAVSKGAKGYTTDEINQARVEALTAMLSRIEKQLESE
ncbi:hypothetical protein ACIBCM_19030 [Streptomyces sp. NPDC051018]|uniref:hypothetical protein n=1 Tax=Streptomyces sp. NPDC051018 TaxID=3365639 RepID=UPI00379E1328